ncbi:universal stress protein [Paracrocinitomix mangrovi]|uniref:universal stress protein n=1 Tax=Paracrocinitomix mangrovi TaxID=2862509 RepID=UPI001C8E8ED6|nr:universal stress protein [Paracrocinitomix mangrovi]UKN03207.1 universal stress protein [Paracrocinitomix mangrovi]
MIKVIITTNFTESARNAMVYAANLFGVENTQYYIMNTFIDMPTRNDGLLSVEQISDRRENKRLKEEVEFLKNQFPNQNIVVKSKSVYGQLVPAINSLVKEIAAQYVVIGNKSKYDFDAGMLRAKTYEMIGKIECPVLAVPENRPWFPGEGGLIFASDLQTIKKPDHLEPLVRIANQHQVPVMVINIKKPETAASAEEEKADTQLSHIFGSTKHEMHKLEDADVLNGINKFVESHGNSLLVLLARKQNLFQRLTQQSVTQKMSKLANLPLLILHDY